MRILPSWMASMRNRFSALDSLVEKVSINFALNETFCNKEWPMFSPPILASTTSEAMIARAFTP